MEEKDLSAVSLADLKELATKGHSKAQYELGRRYYEGNSTRRDSEKAAKWMSKAAKQAHAEAQVFFADMLWNGEGVKEDHEQALSWYYKAAEAGNADAAYELTMIFFNGYPTQQDVEKGLQWLQTAASGENVLARRALDRLSHVDKKCYKSTVDYEIVILLLGQKRWDDEEGSAWVWLERGVQPTKKDANKFLFGCILDFQMEPTTLWNRAEKFTEEILGDPEDLWKLINGFTEREWLSKWMPYPVNRFKNRASGRVRQVARKMVLR